MTWNMITQPCANRTGDSQNEALPKAGLRSVYKERDGGINLTNATRKRALNLTIRRPCPFFSRKQKAPNLNRSGAIALVTYCLNKVFNQRYFII